MMEREPVAIASTRQVRTAINVLMKNDFMPSLFDCMDTLLHEIRESAQSTLFTVESHDVDGGL